MVYEKLKEVHDVLKAIEESVDDELKTILQLVRGELKDAKEQVYRMEKNLFIKNSKKGDSDG